MQIIPSVIPNVIKLSAGRLARRFERQCRRPREVQERLLADILEHNAETAYGQRYGFDRIRSLDDYRRAVPVVDYDALEPYIERMVRGEKLQLTADDPVFFATTSGTTGRPKFIPVTREARRAKAAMGRLWLYHLVRDHPDVFDGGVLSVVSPEEEGRTPAGIPYGSESGHLYRNIPALVRRRYAVPYDIFTIHDYESKYYTILRLCLSEDITMIATANSSTVLLLGQKMVEYQERLLQDLHEGTLDAGLEVPPEIREMLHGRLAPEPERARELAQRLERNGGRLTPALCWPNLRMIGCWKGGSAGLYLQQFPEYFPPDVPIRDWGYLASEVRGSVPLSDEGAGGVLAIGVNVFEFVREAEIDREDRTFLAVEELAAGERYFVFLTTASGLYRYDINDVVEVVGFYERTPVIQFVQKGHGVVSLTGEKLYEAQVVEAVQKAREAMSIEFQFIAASVQWDRQPRYIFLAEFGEKPPHDTLVKLGAAIEKHLRAINHEYKGKRESLRLGHPILKVVAPGEEDRYRRAKIEEGRRDSQFKLIRLNGDFEFQKEFKVVEEVPVSRTG